jgi:hypothetical protein
MVFGDDVVGAALVDRLVHHAEVIVLRRRQLPTQRASPRPRPHVTADDGGTQLVNFR